MNIWLEKTYPSKRTNGDFTSLLLSPTKDDRNADIYSNMRKVTSGDIVFHLDQDIRKIIGYSLVLDEFETIVLKENDYYSVNLYEYQSLISPISVDKFLSDKKNQSLLKDVREKKGAFFQYKNNKYYMRQGAYLTCLDNRIANLFYQNVDKQILLTDVVDTEELFPEGAHKYYLHSRKERNKKLIKVAKENFKNKYKGRLFCEACDFDFVEKYGEIGEDFIEAHHLIPIESLQAGHKTKISEIVMLCANCHRMIHKKRPWLSIDELSTLIK